MSTDPTPLPEGETMDSADLFDLDSDAPLPACPLRNPGDEQPCESCQ